MYNYTYNLILLKTKIVRTYFTLVIRMYITTFKTNLLSKFKLIKHRRTKIINVLIFCSMKVLNLDI